MKCKHCNGLLQPINHPDKCYWDIGLVCASCGREEYIGEIRDSWQDEESPADLLSKESISLEYIKAGVKPGKYI